MRKILLGIILGLLLQKSVAAYYSYSIWSRIEKNGICTELTEMARSSEYIACLEADMGIFSNLKYILYSPDYTFSKWTLRF